MNKVIIGNVLGGVNYGVAPGDMPIINGHMFYLADADNIMPTASVVSGCFSVLVFEN